MGNQETQKILIDSAVVAAVRTTRRSTRLAINGLWIASYLLPQAFFASAKIGMYG